MWHVARRRCLLTLSPSNFPRAIGSVPMLLRRANLLKYIWGDAGDRFIASLRHSLIFSTLLPWIISRFHRLLIHHSPGFTNMARLRSSWDAEPPHLQWCPPSFNGKISRSSQQSEDPVYPCIVTPSLIENIGARERTRFGKRSKDYITNHSNIWSSYFQNMWVSQS